MRITLLLSIAILCSLSYAELPWNYNIEQAFQQAQNTGKLVFVDCYTDWCSWCKKLDQETFTDPRFQELSTNFVLLKVNGDKEPAFCTKYSVRAYPTMLFLKPNGDEVRRIKGFLNADALITIMKEVLGQYVQTMTQDMPQFYPLYTVNSNKTPLLLVWYTDIALAFKKAAETNRIVFVDCYTDWCGWCKKLDQETFTHPDFINISAKFVLLKVDGDKQIEFCRKYNVSAYPTLLFLKADGKEIRRQVGFITGPKLVDIMKSLLK